MGNTNKQLKINAKMDTFMKEIFIRLQIDKNFIMLVVQTINVHISLLLIWVPKFSEFDS